MNLNQQRKQKYFQLSSQLIQMDNRQLAALFDSSQQSAGWGRTQTIEIGEHKVFVKRLPLTELEHQNSFSTQNRYQLPTYYHYGIRSAGFGAFRELVAHSKTTTWVLNGEIENFPLLYHYRIMPFAGERAALDQEWLQGYLQYWGSNESLGKFMRDRANAPYEMVLFLEQIPQVVQPWLLTHLDQIERVFKQLCTILDFLHKKGMIHFDVHFYNMLTDGESVYLTDFGLLLDKSFDLAEDESAFFNRHREHDYGQLISYLIFPIYELYQALPAEAQHKLKEQYGMTAGGDQFQKILFMLLENITEIHANKAIQMDDAYFAHLIRYRAIMFLMGNFFRTLVGNPQKDTPFPHEELRRLLTEAGIHQEE